MGSRVDLHYELVNFAETVYFQPPSGHVMNYPCIVYRKVPRFKESANNGIYIKKQGYEITVIDEDPDSEIADNIEDQLEYSSITSHFVVDGLHHTIIQLFY